MAVQIASAVPPQLGRARAMVFVDGENLTARYQEMLGDRLPYSHVTHERDVFVWSSLLNMLQHRTCEFVRRHSYTAVQGDDARRDAVVTALSAVGIEAPRVFPKTRGRGSKRVDVSLTVDMLTHAHRRNYDVAFLVAGDGDYVPLVDAVAAEGRVVCLWFLESGLSPKLRDAADFYFDIGAGVLLKEDAARSF